MHMHLPVIECADRSIRNYSRKCLGVTCVFNVGNFCRGYRQHIVLSEATGSNIIMYFYEIL